MTRPGFIEQSEELDRRRPESTIFALDIGTRTVIGIVAGMDGAKLEVIAQSITEHENRAVFDGQIHDIFKVAQAVKKVKLDLEEKTGMALGRVAIAAAGRSLKTLFVHQDQEIGDDIEIDPVICRGLETEAVKEAHRQLREEGSGGQEEEFYCVGYSVVSYYLNDYTMTSLLGHYGRRIGVDVLATFLPNSVVNSLYAVLGRVSLEAVSLTLEPIAAASAVIPESYRLLNLALLDIGAGTSDIAITREGAITAYGMVPVAGDEITEALAQGLLADFNTAEAVKRELAGGKEITYTDIMGIEVTVGCTEVLAMLDPVLESLADRIAGEILRLNGNKPPKSVLCVGGGGQVPGFSSRIAVKLGLGPERVGLRGRRFIPDLICHQQEISGPEGVTVVGIAKVALDSVGHNFMTININEKDYKLFHSRDLTVIDALGLIEYNLGDLVGKNGVDLRYVLNGERKVVYGGLCTPAEVYVNGLAANLKVVLADGDRVTIRKAVRGEDARVRLSELSRQFPAVPLRVEGRLEQVEQLFLVNGKASPPDREIAEGDRIEVRPVGTVAELAEVKGIDLTRRKALVNGREAPGEKPLTAGDSVEFLAAGTPGQTGGPGLEGPIPEGAEADQAGQLKQPGRAVEITVNSQKVVLEGKSSYLFVDIFNRISVDLAGAAAGARLKLTLNGQQARYVDPLKEGDVIEVGWE